MTGWKMFQGGNEILELFTVSFRDEKIFAYTVKSLAIKVTHFW